MTSDNDAQDARRARLLDALPAIAWSADAQTFRFTYVNPAAETLLGFPTQQWLDEPDFWMKRLHPEDGYVALICHDETMAGKNHELIYRMIAADGRSVWLRDYVNVHSVDGVPVELFGVMVDITREREAEQASRESRENFRRMVELSPDCIGVHVDGTYVYVNKAFVDLLGAESEAQIVGRDMLSFVDAPDRDEVRDRIARLRTGESVPYQRQRYIRMDGSPLDVEVAALPLRYGNRDAVQVIARDITDKVRAQQALEASELRYRELVEDVTDILFTVDRGGRFLSLSRSFERSTGHPVDEWIGRPYANLFTPHHQEAVKHDFEDVLRGDRGVINEYEIEARSGAIVTVEVATQPRYVDGEVAGMIGMARDVTEQRTIARKLEEAKRMSSLGQVAASLAHEFNNVLMSIQPFVEIIGRQESASPAIADSLDHITRAIRRGKRASQEILRFANPQEAQLAPIDAKAWLPTLLGQVAVTLPPSIKLRSSIDPSVRGILGDRLHLEQVITNLVFNARDAVTDSGTIDVTMSMNDKNAVSITVNDDGPGIAPQMLPQIFEPLFTTKRNGTGLGLAIARRLIEGQGGTLTAENQSGGGASFRLVVQAVDDTSTSPTHDSATPSLKHILLVEDDESVGRGLEALLRSEGYETTWVKAGAEACEAARNTKPQVAIIDVNLPDGSGVDLVPLLRAKHPNLPVVLSTGHVELNLTDEKQRILSLMKPYELEHLLTAIGNVTTIAA